MFFFEIFERDDMKFWRFFREDFGIFSPFLADLKIPFKEIKEKEKDWNRARSRLRFFCLKFRKTNIRI